LPPLSGGGRAIPLREPPGRLALPQVPPGHRIDGGNGHGAFAHSAELRGALLWSLAAPYMLGVWVTTG
jgi:hypothetical protein